LATLGDAGQWDVWRRFSEFCRLWAKVKDLARVAAPQGWEAPVLPAKTFRPKLDPKFLDDRRAQLDKFLVALLAHPEVRKSKDLRAFLGFGSLHGGGGGSGKAGSARIVPRSPPEVGRASAMAAVDEGRSETERVDDLITALGHATAERTTKALWSDAGASHDFSARGPFYMDDHVKANPGPAVGFLVAYNAYRCRPQDGDRIDHIAGRGKCAKLVQEIGRLTAPHRAPNEPALFIVNIQVPGNPVINMVMVYALPTGFLGRPLKGDDAKFRSTLRKYYEDLPVSKPGPPAADEGTCPLDHFRNQRFKLLPRIIDGPWVIKTTVPAKPALLGQKLTQRYFRGECYVETDIHVGSSAVANRITGLCRGASESIAVDVGFCLEGRCEEELPEKVHAWLVLVDTRASLLCAWDVSICCLLFFHGWPGFSACRSSG
jgi:hypothetical protein